MIHSSTSNVPRPFKGIERVSYLFIDGHYLQMALKNISNNFFNEEKLNFNYVAFTNSFTKVFYYDTLPAKKKNETNEVFNTRLKEKETFFEELRQLDKFHVYEGKARFRRKVQMQKGVDTMIAIDMLRHTFRNNMQSATLLAGDLDFQPLLAALVMEGMYTTLWYEPSSISKELLYSADSKKKLTLQNTFSYCGNLTKKYPLPKSLGQHEKKSFKRENAEKVKEGQTSDYTIIVYKQDELYYFIKKKYAIESIIVYHDLSKLEYYMESLLGSKFIWNS